VEWAKEHGTRIEVDLEAIYQKGTRSVDAYLKYTAIVNPHAMIIYTTPSAEQIIFRGRQRRCQETQEYQAASLRR
jgi:DNA topoisomerase-6 subunit B